jgi:hypothetical protein
MQTFFVPCILYFLLRLFLFLFFLADKNCTCAVSMKKEKREKQIDEADRDQMPEIHQNTSFIQDFINKIRS